MKHTYPIIVALVITFLVALAFTGIGAGFALIVGGSAIIAFIVWLLTTYRNPVDGQKILPLYILAVGMQFIHLTEEFTAGFPREFSALTGSHLSSDAFVLIAVLGGGILYMVAGIGLLYRHPVANYLLWFFLIGPAGLVNTLAHFTFPFLNGTPYFPGLITVLLPTIARTTLAWRVLQDSRHTMTAQDSPVTGVSEAFADAQEQHADGTT